MSEQKKRANRVFGARVLIAIGLIVGTLAWLLALGAYQAGNVVGLLAATVCIVIVGGLGITSCEDATGGDTSMTGSS